MENQTEIKSVLPVENPQVSIYRDPSSCVVLASHGLKFVRPKLGVKVGRSSEENPTPSKSHSAAKFDYRSLPPSRRIGGAGTTRCL